MTTVLAETKTLVSLARPYFPYGLVQETRGEPGNEVHFTCAIYQAPRRVARLVGSLGVLLSASRSQVIRNTEGLVLFTLLRSTQAL